MRSHNDSDVSIKAIRASLEKCEKLGVNEKILNAKKIYDTTTRAISLATTDSERAECYELRGYCDEILNAEQRAIEDFSMAIQLGSDDSQQLAQRYWHRSMAYELADQIDLMRADLKGITQLNSDLSNRASELLREYDLAAEQLPLQNLMKQCESAYYYGNLKKAEDYLAEVMQLGGSKLLSDIQKHATAIFELYREQNQYINMVNMVARFPSLQFSKLASPSMDDVLMHMVHLYLKGDYSEAKQIFYYCFTNDSSASLKPPSSEMLNSILPVLLDQNMWLIEYEDSHLRAILACNLGEFAADVFAQRVKQAKEFTFATIKNIADPALRQLSLWQSILPNTFLGSIFYLQRGMAHPSINSGTLKEIMTLLQKEINTSQVKIEMTQEVQEALNANAELKKQLQSKFPKVYARLVQENIILAPGSLMFKQRSDGAHVATTVATPKGPRAQTDADTKQRYYGDADEFSSAPTKKR